MSAHTLLFPGISPIAAARRAAWSARPWSAHIASSLLLVAFAIAPGLAQASEKENCFHTASVKYQLDPWLLVAIARVESRMQPDALRKYDDGSEDIGLMQINSLWLPKLAQHGIARADLFHHCTSIHVAAWIVATQLFRYGKSWHSIGRYHSATPARNTAWVALVASRLRAEHPNFALFNQGLAAVVQKMVTPAASSTAPSVAITSAAPPAAAPATTPATVSLSQAPTSSANPG